jgi:hypothetical protein
MYDVLKSKVNAGMLGKKLFRQLHLCHYSQLAQSGIGIPASGSVRYRWSRISLALPSYAHLYFRHLHWYGGVTVLLPGWVIWEKLGLCFKK